jgi:rRNA-processing protein FCF1
VPSCATDGSQVVLDGNFIFQALKCSINIRDALAKLLQSPNVRLYVPEEAVEELKGLGSVGAPSVAFALTCDMIERCTPTDEAASSATGPRGAAAALLMVAKRTDRAVSRGVVVASMPVAHATPKVSSRGGKVRLDSMPGHSFIATQDKDLRNRLRRIPGVPIIFLNRNVVVLDLPSEATKAASTAAASSAPLLSDADKAAMRELVDRPAAGAKMPRRKKGPKGPNPLSCLPKKAKRSREEEEAAPLESAPKRTRRGKRKPQQATAAAIVSDDAS